MTASGLYCLILLPLLAGAAEKSTAIIDDVAYTKPQKLIRVEAGRRLNLYCTGRGSPTVVFESGQAFPRGPAETQALRDAKNQLWIDLHNQIAAMSTRGKRLTVENTGHYIQLEQPQVVVDSILEVLRTTQGR